MNVREEGRPELKNFPPRVSFDPNSLVEQQTGRTTKREEYALFDTVPVQNRHQEWGRAGTEWGCRQMSPGENEGRYLAVTCCAIGC